MLNKFILGSEQNITKDAYIWNMIGGMLNAGQSALILIVVSRTNPVEDAGIFALAYAIASLTVAVGKFGMRNFQASDVIDSYSFNDYLLSRAITSAFMIVITAIYIVRGSVVLDYSPYKTTVILMMGLLKLTDSVEDVYHGRLQQKGRLDIGAKCMAIRYIGVLVIMSATLILSRDLIIAMVISLVFSWGFFVWSYSVFSAVLEQGEKAWFDFSKQKLLLKECLPIAAGGFLMIYIANAPKYAIDANMNELVQATFNYIFMPVYVINTLSTFIFQPIISKMAIMIEEGDKLHFCRLFARQLGIILVICIGVLGGGFLLGIPVLSLLYNMNLKDNKYAFMVLLLGGCFLALSSFFAVCITILRKQKWLLIGYILPAVVEMIGANKIVQSFGLEGAAWMYSVLISVQMIIFLIIFMISYLHIEKVTEHTE